MKKIKTALRVILIMAGLGFSITMTYGQTSTTSTSTPTKSPKTACEEWSEKYSKAAQEATQSAVGKEGPQLEGSCYAVCKDPKTEDQRKQCQECTAKKIDQVLGSEGNYGKVCTDLIEGIPLSAITAGSSCLKKDGDVCKALLSGSGLSGINSYIAMIYKFSAYTIAILGVLMLIISGIQISIGGASADQVAQGKKRIVQIVGGMVLFALIGVILRTINPNFFQ